MTIKNNLRPLVSILVPGYNEEAIIEKNVNRICHYMVSLETHYRWELLLVNDGSHDRTGEIADKLAAHNRHIQVLHHKRNYGLGQALRYGFKGCNGDYIVTLDMDLSYSVDHIQTLLKTIVDTRAKIVIASPYMQGGKVSNVPFFRRILSYFANRFLGFAAQGNLHTITGMVRAYDRAFVQSLDTKSMDMAINPEIIYKAQLQRAYIVEIPANLQWNDQDDGTCVQRNLNLRRSSLKIFGTIISFLFYGYIFRPFNFFIIPGMMLLITSMYPICWALIHTFSIMGTADHDGGLGYYLSDAIAEAFIKSPHSFIVGGFCMIVAIQLLSLGILSLQKKRYFEELYHLQSTIYKTLKNDTSVRSD